MPFDYRITANVALLARKLAKRVLHHELRDKEEIIERLKAELAQTKERLDFESSRPDFWQVQNHVEAEHFIYEAKERVIHELRPLLSDWAFRTLQEIFQKKPHDLAPTAHLAYTGDKTADERTALVYIRLPELRREVYITSNRAPLRMETSERVR